MAPTLQVSIPSTNRANPTFSPVTSAVSGWAYAQGNQEKRVENAVLTYSHTSACLGDYTFKVDRTHAVSGLEFYFYLELSATTTPPLAVGVGQSVTVGGWDAFPTNKHTSVFLMDDWTDVLSGGWTVDGLEVTVAPTVGALIGDSSFHWSTPPAVQSGGTNLLTGANTALHWAPGTASATYSHTGGVKRPTSANGPSLVELVTNTPVDSSSFSPTYPKTYDWTKNGPFVTYTVTFSSATQWPDIVTSAATKKVLYRNPTGTDQPTYAVYRVPGLSLYWLNASLAFSDVTDISGKAPFPPNDPPSVSWGTAAQVLDPTSAGDYTTTPEFDGTVWNPTFRDESNTVNRAPAGTYLAPVAMVRPPPPMFVYLTLPTTPNFPHATPTCNGYQVQYTVQAKVNELEGECRSYVDCGGSQHCLLVDQLAGPNMRRLTTTTKCVSCIPNAPATDSHPSGLDNAACQCGPHQYCMSDQGLCVDGAGWYVCDEFTHSRYGMCVNKEDVLGGPCRTISLATPPSGYVSPYSYTSAGLTGTSKGGSAPSLALAASGTVDTKGQSPGLHGFCGGVRFYNSTGVEWTLGGGGGSVGIGPSTPSQANLARVVLWTGACVNQVCLECAPEQVPAQLQSSCGRFCLNGAIEEVQYVDGTSRTFTINTVAGTTLAAVLMIILLQLCVCAGAYVTTTLKVPAGEPTPLDRATEAMLACLRPCCGCCRPCCDRHWCRWCCHTPTWNRRVHGSNGGRYFAPASDAGAGASAAGAGGAGNGSTGVAGSAGPEATTSPYMPPQEVRRRRAAPTPPAAAGGGGGGGRASSAQPLSTSPTLDRPLLPSSHEEGGEYA